MNKGLFIQALVKFIAGILLVGMMIFLPAGSFAYWQGWLIPDWCVWIAAVAFLGSYILYGEVLRENTYLFLSMQLILASPISFLIMLGYIPAIAKRIRNEEMVLEEGLDGYKEYRQRVKYKVFPGVW